MENPVLAAVAGNLVIAILILVAVGFLKFFGKAIERNLKHLIALTAGVILSLVFFGFLPKVSENLEHFYIFILAGVLLFYLLEIFLHFHHCSDLESKNHSCEEIHSKHKNLMSFGTFLHNFFHGLVLASAFSISTEAGIGLTIAIALHALPQNIANFLMNSRKWSFVILAASGGVIGALVLLLPFLGDFVLANKFVVLALTAGGLLYLSLSDVIPSINKDSKQKEKLVFFVLVVIGILLNLGFSKLTHHSHDDGHEKHEGHEH